MPGVDVPFGALVLPGVPLRPTPIFIPPSLELGGPFKKVMQGKKLVVKEEIWSGCCCQKSWFLDFFGPITTQSRVHLCQSFVQLCSQERQTHSYLPVLASTHRHQNQGMGANYWSQCWFLCSIALSIPLGHADGGRDKAICFVY
jgi:hypothetical protein